MSKRNIPLSVPNLKGNELKYVTEAIQTEWVSTAGPYISQFEEKLAEYVGASGAVSCQNGTSGIHTVLMCLGINAEHVVIVPTLTFIAAVNPVVYVGAEPIFMDCDDSLCMDPDKLEAYCVQECDFFNGELIARKNGKHVKALIIVHVFGNMADMERIMNIASRYNLLVVEDATEALGSYYTQGKYKGKFAGTIGDAGIYSFNGNKIITTGGGGMIVARDSKVREHANHLTTQAKADGFRFVHDEIGYNYRMTNIQAALGLAQLEQLEDFIETKKQNYQLYRERLDGLPGLSILSFRPDIRPNFWFYSLAVQEPFPKNRDEVMVTLGEVGIQTRPVWHLIHMAPMYQNNEAYRMERSLFYLERIVNLPCSSNLDSDDALYVAAQIVQMLLPSDGT